jgi:hypothetical protein
LFGCKQQKETLINGELIYAKFRVWHDWEGMYEPKCILESYTRIDSVGNILFIKNDSVFQSKIATDSFMQLFKQEYAALPDRTKYFRFGGCTDEYCFLSYYSKTKKQNEIICGAYDKPQFLHFLFQYLDDSTFASKQTFVKINDDSTQVLQHYFMNEINKNLPFPKQKPPIKFNPPTLNN